MMFEVFCPQAKARCRDGYVMHGANTSSWCCRDWDTKIGCIQNLLNRNELGDTKQTRNYQKQIAKQMGLQEEG